MAPVRRSRRRGRRPQGPLHHRHPAAARPAEAPLKVSGFTFVRNAVRLRYPLAGRSGRSCPLVDEMVVNVGRSDDGTLDLVRGIGDPRIVIIESGWDEESLVRGARARRADRHRAGPLHRRRLPLPPGRRGPPRGRSPRLRDALAACTTTRGRGAALRLRPLLRLVPHRGRRAALVPAGGARVQGRHAACAPGRTPRASASGRRPGFAGRSPGRSSAATRRASCGWPLRGAGLPLRVGAPPGPAEREAGRVRAALPGGRGPAAAARARGSPTTWRRRSDPSRAPTRRRCATRVAAEDWVFEPRSRRIRSGHLREDLLDLFEAATGVRIGEYRNYELVR